MEIETLKGDYLAAKPLIKYLGYNFPFTENDLNGLNLGKTYSGKDVDDLVEMSNVHNREELYRIGEVAAKESVREEDFG